jgi:N-acetylmuramoyl-L-alanine amidase
MRIFSFKRRVIKLVFFSVGLVVFNIFSLNYFMKGSNVVGIVDIWANSHIEQAALSQTIGNAEDVNLKWLAGKIIAIDPGHGGIDNGAERHGHKEKDINLEIAMKLAKELRAHSATVILTREDDVDYYTKGTGGKRNDLLRRSKIIKESGAEVFVSIHCNAIKDASWFGAQVFYNSKIAQNKELAETMQKALKNFPPGNKRQAKQDSHIFLLKSLNIPGVLIEAGFISNKKEAGALGDDEYQESIAKSVVQGLAHYWSRL